MPQIDVSRKELETLIACVMQGRAESWLVQDEESLPDLHLKLENYLEAWINGGVVELSIPERFKKLGVVKWEKVFEAHPENPYG